jgi:hypothetical protein
VFKKFMEIDLHPEVVDNVTMGYIFEELIRKFSELSNETAGEHFTPREVIRLMVDLLFMEDDDRWHTKGIIKTLYDPAAGTGGMLSVAEQYIRELNPGASLKTFGQELNPESFAICKLDLMIKGQDASQIKFGNSFTQDGLKNERFDYFLSNPPFGVEWKKVEREIRDEHEKSGMDGRFGVGLPRDLGRLALVSATHGQQVQEGRAGVEAGHRLQRLAPVHRRGRLGRERDPPLAHRERLARSHRRVAAGPVLQHRHQHLHLDRHEPQERPPQGQDPTDRRLVVLHQDAEVARQQAERDQPGADRGDRLHLRQLPRRIALQDLP